MKSGAGGLKEPFKYTGPKINTPGFSEALAYLIRYSDTEYLINLARESSWSDKSPMDIVEEILAWRSQKQKEEDVLLDSD